MEWNGISSVHGNSHQHIAAPTQEHVTSFDWEQIGHPSYSLDLAASDFHLFLHVKKPLFSQHYNNDYNIKKSKRDWPSSQLASFYKKVHGEISTPNDKNTSILLEIRLIYGLSYKNKAVKNCHIFLIANLLTFWTWIMCHLYIMMW